MSRKPDFILDNRLSLCASFVREGTALADVGTDHAYLPVMLALQGRIKSAAACDVRQGPLENAENNIRFYGVEKQVTAILSDGLDNVPPELALDVVIAGMGGELMAEIIKRTQWLYDGSRNLILQPMTRMESLRSFLFENGFNIIQEKACVSGGKCYCVMQCRYDGIIRECSLRQQYIGSLNRDDSPEAKRYISMVAQKLKRKINGLLRSHDSTEAAHYQKILEEIGFEE